MTDEAAVAYEPDQAARPGAGRVATMAAVGLVTVLAVIAGAGTAFLIATPAPAPEPEATEGEGETPATPAAYAAAGPVVLVPMTPVITNIAAPQGAVIRLEMSLVLRGGAEEAEVLAAQIGADTLVFMRSVELAQIEGARGLLHLREDLKERATLRSPDVVDLVIHSMVAQ